jgi:Protein of unknown function (DUF3833)
MNPTHRHRRLYRSLAFTLLTLALGGCASLQTASFSGGRPVFDPQKFFAGHTRSWGVIETRTGQPSQVITTESRSHWEGKTLQIEQDLVFGHDQPKHRTWRLSRLDAHHYTATGSDIVGTARGEAWGNVFHWTFMAQLTPGNPLAQVQMCQWMYLQPDGRTMINRDTISKAGLIVAGATEQFRKED